MNKLRRKDLIYPELSYVIVGILFEVYNKLGPGHKEKYYQKALSIAFKEAKLAFKEQLYVPLTFKGSNVGKYYLDFLIDDKIVLEIKAGEKFLQQNINQVLSYLKVRDLRLGIIANFTKEGLKFRRIVNTKNS